MSADVLPETFKKLREEKGLSQAKMAEIFGLSLSMVQKYEGGTSIPSYDVLIAMSEYFNVEFRIRHTEKHPLHLSKGANPR